MAQSSHSARIGVTLAGAGMAALCVGFKRTALTLFGAGVRTLELDWHRRHPEFRGGPRERWQASLDFYRETHQNPMNRRLHLIGIPLIAAGAAGLFVAHPFSPISGGIWLGSLGAFGVGWCSISSVTRGMNGAPQPSARTAYRSWRGQFGICNSCSAGLAARRANASSASCGVIGAARHASKPESDRTDPPPVRYRKNVLARSTST